MVVTGGLGGAMEAACRGAKRGGGTTIGILPGDERAEANAWVDVAVPTGFGDGRNALVVRAADAAADAATKAVTLAKLRPGAHHREDREVVAATGDGHHGVPHLVVPEPDR